MRQNSKAIRILPEQILTGSYGTIIRGSPTGSKKQMPAWAKRTVVFSCEIVSLFHCSCGRWSLLWKLRTKNGKGGGRYDLRRNCSGASNGRLSLRLDRAASAVRTYRIGLDEKSLHQCGISHHVLIGAPHLFAKPYAA